jgi:CRP-like cAMP-binding protein
VAKGDVVGEMSLLTGASYNATVRAVEGAVVFEIGAHQHGRLVRDRPAFAAALAELMAQRLGHRQARLGQLERGRAPLGCRLRRA